jgi:hypothetical protein
MLTLASTLSTPAHNAEVKERIRGRERERRREGQKEWC